MRVIERSEPEQSFFEGEPDLEPPEELATHELDDQAVLEEDIDNEDVLEEDVDEDILTDTLESLVHPDGDEDDEEEEPETVGHLLEPAPEVDLDDEEFDVGDVEQSLDAILRARTAEFDLDGDEAADGRAQIQTEDLEPMSCRPDEFVCRSCYLVCNRTQLADAQRLVCRDCTS
jgi:hypothetical protein